MQYPKVFLTITGGEKDMDSTLTINKHRSTNTNYFYNAGTNVDKTILIVKDALTTTTISITNTTRTARKWKNPRYQRSRKCR